MRYATAPPSLALIVVVSLAVPFGIMDRVELCREVDRCTTRVLVVDDDQVVVPATGVVFHPRGLVLTARHVVCNEDGLKGKKVLAAVGESYVPCNVKPGCDFMLESHIDEIDDIVPDIAILVPNKYLEEEDYLPLREDILSLGEGVLIAGFADESVKEVSPKEMVNIRSDTDEYYDYNRLEMEILKYDNTNMMIKHGMVGSKDVLSLGEVDMESIGLNERVSIRAAYYGIDNYLTDGGSGGAVVDMDGRLAGVVIKRTRTRLEGRISLLPAGTGVAVSHHFVTWMMEYQ